ncbi:MAG: enoyl-CoA hydratase/isomerase family protein [Phycisphaerales bacterium]|nr:enoyl-CoA hydratase/isomerase family protein [Planctomycetota bacterium]
MIRTHVHGDVYEVVLARAEKRNALTPDMLGQLCTAIGETPREAGGLLLTGEGAVFCAGFDLSLCKDAPGGEVMRALLEGLHRAISALRRLEIPVVVGAHGAAIAGGCALLGGGDLVVTNSDAKLGYPVVRLGVSPAISAPFLRRLAGDGVARSRMLENGLISGREALVCGLAHECLPAPDAVRDFALEAARMLAAKPRGALAATRRWLDEISPIELDVEALHVSTALAGGEEERRLLPQAWAAR